MGWYIVPAEPLLYNGPFKILSELYTVYDLIRNRAFNYNIVTTHNFTLSFISTWKTNIISPCRELQMAKRYLNTMVSRLNASSPNTHVSPSNGRSIAEPLRPSFTFLNLLPAIVLVAAAPPSVRFVLTCLTIMHFVTPE